MPACKEVVYITFGKIKLLCSKIFIVAHMESLSISIEAASMLKCIR